ncbi:MAG: NHL repeat-containing protein [Armatimonadia bacterium]
MRMMRMWMLLLVGVAGQCLTLPAVADGEAYMFVRLFGLPNTGRLPTKGYFYHPETIAVDVDGNVYVGDGPDPATRSLQKFTSEGRPVWMVTTYYDPGTQTKESLDWPSGIAVTKEGDIYACTGKAFVRFSKDGQCTGATKCIGMDVAIDDAGNLYTLYPRLVTKYAASGGQSRYQGDFVNGDGDRGLRGARGIAAAPDGCVYIADADNPNPEGLGANRIIKLAPDGQVMGWLGKSIWVEQYAVDSGLVMGDRRPGTIGWHKATGSYHARMSWPELSCAGTEEGAFRGPRGLAVDAEGNLFVADTRNSRIQKFDRNGQFVTAWGERGAGDGEFVAPVDIAVDAAGSVYVVDAERACVQVFAKGKQQE